MDKLKSAELDLLERINAKKELQPFFFRKVKGLKWFDTLAEQKYFDPASNPEPIPAKEEGFITVPFWPVTEYLVATSPELRDEKNIAYAKRVLDIIRDTTRLAKKQNFSNYRTWWQFSKIIQHIPIKLITPEDFTYIDYWLDDKYECGLVADELGENWLVSLLDESSDESITAVLELLRIIYKFSFPPNESGGSERGRATFRFSYWCVERITKSIASKSGTVVGWDAVNIFKEGLNTVVETTGNNEYSSLWRSAIEDHDQNSSASDVKDVLVVALRDSLIACIRKPREDKQKAADIVEKLLNDPLIVIKRVAIFAIGKNYQQLSKLIDKVVAEEFFAADFRHEMWHLLHDCYPLFSASAKQQVQEIIEQLAEKDDEGNIQRKETADKQATWLSAIRNHETTLNTQYQACVKLAGAEPAHPEFPFYRSSGAVVYKSPKSTEELLAMGMDGLVAYLDGYKDPGDFREPGIGGLVKALKSAVKAAPLEFARHIHKFSSLKSPYVYALVGAFSELWTEKEEFTLGRNMEELVEFL